MDRESDRKSVLSDAAESVQAALERERLEAAERSSANLVNLRRRSDWTGEERGGEDAQYAAYRAAVDVGAATLAAYDGETGDHSDDVCTIAEAIAGRLELTDVERSHVLAAAQLHDIGKIGVPSQVITKPGPLDDAEWGLIREHTVMGERILETVPEMGEVARIVRHSHERWDGEGYPDGVSGEHIPLASRIVFCADAFHAIRCDRSYRRGRSARRAFTEIEKHSGTQFDPSVVEALRGVAKQLAARRRRRVALPSKRTQRLAALLLALTVSSTALAGTGAWRSVPLVGGGGTPPAAATSCGPGGCMAPVPAGTRPYLPQALVPPATLAAGPARPGDFPASARRPPARKHGRSQGRSRAAGQVAQRRAPASRRSGGASTSSAGDRQDPTPGGPVAGIPKRLDAGKLPVPAVPRPPVGLPRPPDAGELPLPARLRRVRRPHAGAQR